ncbi:MAG: YggS family pyridoxal phosphate-dependent enzyme [Aquabacterium sp.]|uniref:YggS family pyridoxal phosphate-dependent enzyme n=1 Tax=Aquabacterium sp. TaxID=1872578 RepID=UPI0025BFB3EC|nr:YggS family pyridoxal phosphate-dependent enzyme [Aquabacterium sp.]MBI5924892.1 YggS family pyridoxal phosphate-dependent enzyme [Aquabacterium sp.]
MATIANNLQLVRARINQACSRVGRAPDSVTLLAVSKTFPAETVREAFHAGQRKFGENYVQEAIDKIAALGDLRDQIEWHMIGPLQSNKTRVVAEQFDWVHTVDRLKIAQRLNEQRPAHLPPLQVCIQVNTSGEASKSGAAPDEALELARSVMNLPRLRLRGVMALPAPTSDPALQKAELRNVRVVFDTLRSHGIPLDTLSMGMSGDMEVAVEEGSSMLRVGTALFGNR